MLRRAGVPDPENDARFMLAAATGLERLELILSADRTLTQPQEQRFAQLLLCREKREPLQYLLGEQCFYGLDFSVDGRVLIPRQETETLCEIGIGVIFGKKDAHVLDLCTGSGAIAVVIKHECPQTCVTAVDLSADALALAESNAKMNGADIRFLRGDLFAPVRGERFDLILSNPPYIPSADCDALQPEVMREPRMALDGGADGLDFYRRIANEANELLAAGGMLAVEVGDGQADAVKTLFERGGLIDVKAHNDLYGHARVVSGSSVETPT